MSGELDHYYYKRKSSFRVNGVDTLDLEKDREDNFRKGHVCPDLVPHHREKLEYELSHSSASCIGTNTYIKCTRCGCMQDITDYGSW